MEPVLLGRWAISVVAAVAFSWFIEWSCARRGVLPPGFRDPLRRWVARLAVAGVLWIGIFLPLAMIGHGMPEEQFTAIPTPRLFLLHVLLVAALLIWMLAGYAGVAARPVPASGPEPVPPAPGPDLVPLPAAPAEETAAGEGQPAGPAGPVAAMAEDPAAVAALSVDAGNAADAANAADIAPGDRVAPEPAPPGAPVVPVPAAPEAGPQLAAAPGPPPSLLRRMAAQLGLLTSDWKYDLSLGVVMGVGSWVAVIAVVVAISALFLAFGGEKLLPKQPPALVGFIAGLPFLVRLGLSLSAGVVEETFFRGFLQPRVGLLLSTVLFALAHASYGQPFMLIGVTVLSLIYGLLVKWRRTVWPSIAAHALFDGVQLLVIIPAALKFMGSPGARGAARGVAALVGIG